MKKYLIICIIIFTFHGMSSQSLKEFQWENRVILVLTDSLKSQAFEKQLNLLESDLHALKDRKLILIHAVHQKRRILFSEGSEWQDSEIYKQYKSSGNHFEVILIGLDGRIKLRQKEILETAKLYDLIDSMPLRQAEKGSNN